MDIELMRPGNPPNADRFFWRLNRLHSEECAVRVARAIAHTLRRHNQQFPQTRTLGPLTGYPLQMHLLRRWGMPPAVTPPDAKSRQLTYFMRQFLALRSTHPCLRIPGNPPLEDRLTTRLWFTALEQELLGRAPKFDMARSWLLYEVVWPDLVRAGDVTLPPGTQITAMGAMHNALIFCIALWLAGGWIPDPVAHFKSTGLTSALPQLLDNMTELASSFAARHAHEPRYPLSFRNPFAEFPILRTERGSLLAPDPSVLFLAFERSTTFRMLREWYESAGEDGFDRASTALGKVFEEYGRRLLSAPQVRLGGRFLPEFNYPSPQGQIASPDAFILGNTRSTVFEFKATRYPYSTNDLTQNPGEHLWSWLSKILGMTTTRSPLDQGAAFFAQAPTLAPVSATNLANALYVVVVYPDVPPMLNWRKWRTDWLLRKFPILQPNAALLDRTAFISIMDLEVAVAAASAPNGLGAPTTFSDLLFEWWNYTYTGQPFTRAGMRGGLRDYLLRRYPQVSAMEPQILTDARNDLFDAAMVSGFGDNPWDMPKNWWDAQVR